MKGDVIFAGRKIRITIGALEELDDGSFPPAVAINALAANIYTARELTSVLSAGLKAAGEKHEDVNSLIDSVGIRAARDAALDALRRAFEGANEGNASAVAKVDTPTTDS